MINDTVLPVDAETTRLLGDPGDLQESLGLDADAFRRVVARVGNYDEIFNDNLSRIGLQRADSLNASYLNGGLIYAPPLR